jgi:bifunctional UDP-N-acetylglucosamine pyrophosphorylase / glucosamine-1-phosphate N-acetyltransferase
MKASKTIRRKKHRPGDRREYPRESVIGRIEDVAHGAIRKTLSPGAGKLAIAIMAAGKGTRLKSKHPKVLHSIAGKTLLEHVIAAATMVVPAADVYVIIGHEAERVRTQVKHTGVGFALQSEQRGTGHAIMSASEALAGYDNVLVLSGDVPLIQAETITRLRDFHLEQRAAMTILTAVLADPTGYGRVVRKIGNEVAAIVEQKSLRGSQERIREINTGIYGFQVKPLLENLNKLTTDNAHQEYYLTDIASLLVRAKKKVVALLALNVEETLGINTRAELAQLDSALRMRKNVELMQAGVTLFQPQTAMIDSSVQIAPDTTIDPYVQIFGNTRIGTDCRIRSYSVIRDCEIGDNVEIRPGCILSESRIATGAVLGPYAHVRPGSDIGEGAHVGNFVETKKARLGKGSKANHLTYLGDAQIGDNVNVGAGTITCNYDGVHKHTTVIEDGAFIGSDCTLVAPVRVGRGAYVAAASCITEDVPAESLAIARGQQVNKEGWVKKKQKSALSTQEKQHSALSIQHSAKSKST